MELAQSPVQLIYRKEEINFSTKFGTITVSILIDSRRFEVSQGTTRGNLNIRLKKIYNIFNLEAANHLGLVCFVSAIITNITMCALLLAK